VISVHAGQLAVADVDAQLGQRPQHPDRLGDALTVAPDVHAVADRLSISS